MGEKRRESFSCNGHPDNKDVFTKAYAIFYVYIVCHSEWIDLKHSQ